MLKNGLEKFKKQISNHSNGFWAKVGEHKYTERARRFLIAKGMEKMEESNGEEL